jgi:hypothetical protein
MQCINSIVWNKNMIDRAPVYCDICKFLRRLSNSTDSPHSNPHPSWAQCRNPRLFTLHHPSPL